MHQRNTPSFINNIKVAIVHDFLFKLGGAEKVLLSLHDLYPNAPIYTLIYDQEGTKGLFKSCDVRTSKLQKLPKFIQKYSRFLLAKFPQAIEEFDFSEYDIVISSSNSFAHGVITGPSTLHITYCYSPMRYVWDWTHNYLRENNLADGLLGLGVRSMLSKLRLWDYYASSRTDFWIAISETVRQRIKKYYRQESIVIYPPVEVEQFLNNKYLPDKYFLIISRLTPYKKIDLAIEAFNKLKMPLYIIGEGSDRKRLEKISKSNIKFLGWKSEKEKIEYCQKSRAFIFPGEDDFGITPVEAMAAGRPVLAYGAGGATETVIAGKTGEFFYNDEDSQSLIDAVKKIEKNYQKYKTDACQNQAKKFRSEVSQSQIKKYIFEQYKIFKKL